MFSRKFLNRLTRVLFALPLLMVFTSSVFFAETSAAEEKERKYDDVKTKQRQAVGAKCAKKLESVQEVLGADTEPSNQQLSKIANDLRSYIDTSCTSSYEKSQVWNMAAYSYYSLERYPEAINAYKKAIAEPEADERQKVSIRYTIAQLYMVQEDYGNAVKQLEQWMKEATIVSSDGKILLAQAYYQLGRKNDSLKLVNAVIADSEAKSITPKEGWWGLQRVLYYEKKDYKQVVNILKKLVTHYPRMSYWKQLGGMYAELEQDMNQLVSYDLVFLQKGLSKERQLMSLAYMYLGAEVPYRAAKIIEDGMKAGIIEETGKNLEVLGSAWQAAQDSKRAAGPLERAAKLSGEGKIWSRLAGVYLDSNKNKAAVRAARNALKKGGLKRPDMTQMTLGSALVNLHCYDDAVKAFKEAKKHKKSEKAAGQWIKYATSEGSRRAKLIESGAKIAGCKKV
ncbi:MAG: tetratricopeptide repeat protein [Porticoccaceae bacterium]|nr:tetratricopeptide repeat protein [Pseudomonadales bacterium]